MACACKNKTAAQPTAVQQVVKEPVAITKSTIEVQSSNDNDAATTVKKNVVKRIMFRRRA